MTEAAFVKAAIDYKGDSENRKGLKVLHIWTQANIFLKPDFPLFYSAYGPLHVSVPLWLIVTGKLMVNDDKVLQFLNVFKKGL